ncbi:cyclic GMP-AMP synthase-like receptor isoform X1 [Periplaneta americana]|uniref:cyclic GMP-AMP synthase-like receptor isoform X1 n=2 Tax=Periplaneta americana TaxID=6978 RepID=UPI0037E866C7
MSSKKSEAALETVLHAVQKNYISLNDQDMKIYGDHFTKVLTQLIELMKQEDALFKAIYSRLCGAGSYYDGLKVGKPEEYDMDVVMRLPINYNDIIIDNSGVPAAFTKVKITKGMDQLRQHPEWTSKYRYMDSWRNKDDYLLETEFRKWIESVVNKALNTLKQKKSNCYELVLENPDGLGEKTPYQISLTKSGPAMTFNIIIPPDNAKVDVDFVPVIEFTHPKWPPHHVRSLSPNLIAAKRTSWFIVPKPKKGNTDGTLWRLAFHEQEREMINDKGVLKPVCRLLKKFRDTQGINIASYYLKTLFLWEVDIRGREFWTQKQGFLFMHMLKVFRDKLQQKSINYYWDKRYDLTEGYNDKNKKNICDRLNKIIEKIEKEVETNPMIVAKFILPKKEFESLEKNTILPNLLETASVSSTIKQHCGVPVVVKESSQQVQAKKSEPKSGSPDVAAKLNQMMTLLQTLNRKVDSLTDTVNQLRDDNATLRDQLRLGKQQNCSNRQLPSELDVMLLTAENFARDMHL